MAFYWYSGGERSARRQLASAVKPAQAQPADASNPYQRLSAAPVQRAPAVLASQIMTSPVHCLQPTDTYERARSLFQQSRYRHVPIVSDAGALVGIISDRDILREAAHIGEQLQPWLTELISQERTIAEFMTKRVLTATPQAEIRNVAKVLFEERIGGMPIVEESGKVVGIVTRSDILRVIVNRASFELWI
jgi:acetoin utilization protein AcuB